MHSEGNSSAGHQNLFNHDSYNLGPLQRLALMLVRELLASPSIRDFELLAQTPGCSRLSLWPAANLR